MFGSDDAEIQAGDRVRHKGGGPLLVVEATWTDEDGVPIAGCSWFTDEGRTGDYRYEEIAVAALDLVQSDAR